MDEVKSFSPDLDTDELRITRLAGAVEMILRILDIDVADTDFMDTPVRVARWLHEMTEASRDPYGIEDIFRNKTYPSTYDQIIMCVDVTAYGICPHHLLPVEYTVHVGYIPNEDDSVVVGISKLARVVKFLAKQPVLQEEFTELIADALDENLGPHGTGVVVHGRHACMRTRGVEQDSPIVTSIMRGAFRDSDAARAEFFLLIGQGRSFR